MIYVNQTNATNLAYVTNSGTAIIKVDNTSFVPFNDKRNSVRITTNDYFEVGTVWVIDAIHLPFGCSVCTLRPLGVSAKSVHSDMCRLCRYGRASGRRATTGQTMARSTL